MNFTEPPNIHWFDVRESYFNGFRQNLSSFFKAHEGMICEYDEMKKTSLYCKPFYREHEKDLVMEEARQFLFWSNKDYSDMKQKCQGFGRTMVQVIY